MLNNSAASSDSFYLQQFLGFLINQRFSAFQIWRASSAECYVTCLAGSAVQRLVVVTWLAIQGTKTLILPCTASTHCFYALLSWQLHCCSVIVCHIQLGGQCSAHTRFFTLHSASTHCLL